MALNRLRDQCRAGIIHKKEPDLYKVVEKTMEICHNSDESEEEPEPWEWDGKMNVVDTIKTLNEPEQWTKRFYKRSHKNFIKWLNTSVDNIMEKKKEQDDLLFIH